MDNIIIRATVKKDIPQLVEIDKLIWNEKNTPALSIASTVEEYEEKHQMGSQFVAVKNDQVAGYIGYRQPIPIPSNQHVLEIDIGIHPDFQGQGIGKKLLQYMEKWAKTAGYKKISLRVLATNPNAINFYKKNGYVEQGCLVKEFFIDGQYVDDYLFYKLL